MRALGDVEVVRPTNLAEGREAMLDRNRGRSLVIRGAGTKLDWGAPERHRELVVDTTGLDRVLAHDPADATARVEAGMPLAALQGELAGHGQWLAIDPPHDQATVGGVFAANATGPRRLRHGSMRDLVIGMTVVTSDGAVARSGGNVIKNVAGYDLTKLLCGSLGTLGLVAELSVRLHPLPEASTTITARAAPALATQLALEILASPWVVSAVDWWSGAMAVRIEGRSAAVRDQTREVSDLLTRRGAQPEILESDDEARLWRRVADAHAGRAGETVAVAATLPSGFADAADGLAAACAPTGADAQLASHVGSGLHTARFGGADASVHAAAVQAWRARVASLGGHVVVRRRHPQLTDPAVIWGPPPPAVGLMRAVKDHFDPGGRCAPGRFMGGI